MITRRLLYASPLVLMGAGAFGFYSYMRSGRDPRGVPSVLVGKPPPVFDLPALNQAGARFTNAALTPGRPVLVNFFASWCPPCRIEHPQLMRLAREGVRLLGIAYKDQPEASRGFLAELGDPYAATGVDRDGRAAIEWGLYGVPETYLIDPAGIVRWRMAGPVTPEILADQLRPLLARHAA
jgi:cytochrome c biogenesis protein CcmG/thiol:disulfide interchange protein DsbE